MSDYVDTREGWRMLRDGEAAEGDWVQRYDKERNSYTTWVREAPVPPLPTEPYTIIRAAVRLSESDHVIVLNAGGFWYSVADEVPWDADDLSRISSFKVLSEPRAVTAKAVLDLVRAMPLGYRAQDLADKLSRELGVTT